MIFFVLNMLNFQIKICTRKIHIDRRAVYKKNPTPYLHHSKMLTIKVFH